MKTPVIIDADPGVDDVIAILLALASPELDVRAIIISYGNTTLEASHLNIIKLYHTLLQHLEQFPEQKSRFPGLSGDRKVILAKGCSHPLAGADHSAEYFHGRDGLGDMDQRHPDLSVEVSTAEHSHLLLTDRPGVEVALDLIESEPSRSITYVALGPLTNLAQLLRLGGDSVRDRIGRVVCMGGALDVPGNTSPVAEFNFFADPYAVKELLTPDDPNTSIPLERFLLLPSILPLRTSYPSLSTLLESTQPSKTRRSFLERTREIMVGFGKDAMELHDIVAVWCAIANPPVEVETVGALPKLQPGWKASRRKFQLSGKKGEAASLVGEITRGMCVVDLREDPGAYAPGANRAEVQAELEKHHLHHSGPFESTALPAQVEVERASDAQLPNHTAVGGVACVFETPGPEALLTLLLERVWGVTT
ncbi:nucleoside hydrolase [Fomitopsis serialis]|uniref:nucleoside hydrolase n=1 Tax=Fomitopsis serialis TaxID=139415 RepID=UPI00200821E8|nr:nucleoside hydrolase [Neoantrodia serialis]KAH9935513.1 nucleoside hydrolase [Neoantrodia serialis]